MDRMDKLTTLFESDEQLYFCVGLIILVGAIVIICAMVNDYREYLDAHLRTRFRLREFLREEKFYLSLIPQHYYKLNFFKYLSNKKLPRILSCRRIHLS